MNIKTKAIKALAPSVLLVANLFIFGTFAIFHGNVEEFNYGFFKILALYALPLLVIVLFFVVLGCLFSGKKFTRYISILFVFGMLVWFQGNFLMWNYGALDGRGVDWDRFYLFGWLDISIWFLFLIGAYVFHSKISKILVFACWAMIALQTIPVTYTYISGKSSHTDVVPIKSSPAEQILGYSSSQNVIHIVFDSLQTDVFMELLKEENMEKDLEGFVFFKGNAGVAPLTSFSLPAVFSGNAYNGDTLPSTYFSKSMENGFHNILFDKGFDVNLIPHVSMRNGKYSNYYNVSHFSHESTDQLIYKETLFLLDVALFRHSPHFIREKIYNDNNWVLSSLLSGPEKTASFQAKAFLRYYIQHLRVDRKKPCYHFMHLIPPHPPYVTEKDGSYAGKVLLNTRENYKNETKYILKLFIDFIIRLKELDIYDSSLIILHGDHGSMITPVLEGQLMSSLPERAAALLTVKAPYSKGEMSVSDIETSLSDIPATVMEILGFEHHYNGDSIFSIDSEKSRTRLFVFYTGGEKQPKLIKHTINGNIFDPRSWNKKTIPVLTIKPDYELGTIIKFGIAGNADPYKGSGWSAPSSHHEWNSGNKAELNFNFESMEKDLVIEAEFIPFIHPGKVDKQRIYLYANNKKIAQLTAKEYKSHSLKAAIDREIIKDGVLKIGFEFPDAVSPRLIDAGGDSRELAIALISIVIRHQ